MVWKIAKIKGCCTLKNTDVICFFDVQQPLDYIYLILSMFLGTAKRKSAPPSRNISITASTP